MACRNLLLLLLVLTVEVRRARGFGVFGSSRRYGGTHRRNYGGKKGIFNFFGGNTVVDNPPSDDGVDSGLISAPRQSDSSEVSAGWEEDWDGLVPTLLDSPPSQKLTVQWPNNVRADAGNVIEVGAMRQRPELSWQAEQDEMYTVMLVDGGIERLLPETYLHWMVMNVPGGKVEEGVEVLQYVTPFSLELEEDGSIIKDTKESSHPMIVLVFKQRSGKVTNITETQRGCSPDIVTARIFDHRQLAEKYNLELVAGNFLQCPYSEGSTEEMLCRITKCTKQPFPFNMPGINDGAECEPNKRILDFTLRGPKVGKRVQYARATSIFSPESFPLNIRSFLDISTGRTKEFRAYEGRFNILRAAPEGNLAETLEGDMNLEMLEYIDEDAAARTFDLDEPVVRTNLPIFPDIIDSGYFYKVVLAEPYNQDFDFYSFLEGDVVGDLVMARVKEGEEERFQELRDRIAAKGRNNKKVISWDKFIVREDIIEATQDDFKSTPFYTPPTDRIEINTVTYGSAEARNEVFQELFAEDPEFFQEYLSIWTCAACMAITDDLHPTYYGPFKK